MGYLNVDFGRNKIRLLETDGTARKLKLKAFRMVDTRHEGGNVLDDPASSKLAAETLKGILSKEKFSRDPSSLALDSSFTITRDLSLPFKGDDQIRKVIKYETEGYIQHDIDDVVVSYFKRSETIDKSNLMVIAAKKSDLRKHLEFLDVLNVDPLFIDIDSLCLFNALSGTGYLQDHNCFVVLKVDHDITEMMVIAKGRLVTSRAIPMGASHLTAALNHDLKENQLTEDAHAGRLLGLHDDHDLTVDAFLVGMEEQDGERPAPQPAGGGLAKRLEDLALKRQNEFLGKLRRETVRMLTFVTLETPPEKVFLTGPGHRIPGLKDTMGAIFNTEVADLDLLSRVEHSFDAELADTINHEIGVALGLAFKQVGHDATKVDLRQEDVKYAKKFDQVKVPLAFFSFFLFILMVFLNLDVYKERRSKQRDMEYIYRYSIRELGVALGDRELAKTAVASASEDSRRGVLLIQRKLKERNDELLGELGRGGTIPELPSAFPVWHAFFDALVKNDEKLEIFRLDKLTIDTTINPPLLTITGEVATGADMSTLQSIVGSLPMFYDVVPGDTAPSESGNRRFTNFKAAIDYTKVGK